MATITRLIDEAPAADVDVSQHVRGADYHVTLHHFFGGASDVKFGPEAFLAEVPPGAVTGTHYHDVDQYQVFFSSPGATYQRSAIRSVTVHYTDAYTPYGPFSAGSSELLRFFTLRAVASGVHAPMPESRKDLPYHGKRHYTVDLTPLLEGSASISQVSQIIPPEDDGLAASLVTLKPGEEFTPPYHGSISGRCYCVVNGGVVIEGRELSKFSLGWSTDEASRQGVRLQGGSPGCGVLVLDYPHPATPDRE